MTFPAGRPKVLVLSLPPYRFATRARKAAASFAGIADTRFLGLEVAGRTARRDRAGISKVDGVTIKQVRVSTLRTDTATSAQLHNLIRGYLPAFARLVVAAVRSPADLVFVSHPTLSFIGALHRKRFGSILIQDVPERPGLITLRGSAMSKFARIERWILQWVAPQAAMATVVVPSDVPVVERIGFASVGLLRNAPLEEWRAPFTAPPRRDKGPLEAVIVSSIFQSRGFETILSAVAKCNKDADLVRLRVYGPSSEQYLRQLMALCDSLQLNESVLWCGNLETSEVSQAYLSAHVGLVIYEPSNPGNDGLSNKIMECVSSGRPVLASDLPENRAFVNKHDVGWLTDVTVDALAQSLRNIATVGDLGDVSERCRRLGDAELTWEKEFAQVLDAVQSTAD